jgi:thiosulfate/3-mercaptopyruvate sulfurtransferase
MRRLLFLSSLAVLLFAADPWTSDDVVKPEQIASAIASADPAGPLVIHVGFAAMYHGAHISGARYAGPASKPEGLEELKKAVSNEPRNRPILLYCGCCPWDKCPNIRPSFAALRDAGFTNVKVVMLPENLKTDWIDKGYPTDKSATE